MQLRPLKSLKAKKENRVIMNFARDNFKLQFENYYALVC